MFFVVVVVVVFNLILMAHSHEGLKGHLFMVLWSLCFYGFLDTWQQNGFLHFSTTTYARIYFLNKFRFIFFIHFYDNQTVASIIFFFYNFTVNLEIDSMLMYLF